MNKENLLKEVTGVISELGDQSPVLLIARTLGILEEVIENMPDDQSAITISNKVVSEYELNAQKTRLVLGKDPLGESAPTQSAPDQINPNPLAAANGGYWCGEHPEFPVEDWKLEVKNNDTRQGYWEWVAKKMDEE